MVDTVVLLLPKGTYSIVNPARFGLSKSFKNAFVYAGKPLIFKSNPTKEDILKYGYMPRLTLIKSWRGEVHVELKIEFSLPKMVYGNNFDEIEETDLPYICQRIIELCPVLGIKIHTLESIYNSFVSAIHYSKNIVLTDYSTPSQYINYFQKANIKKVYDTSDTRYENDGEAVRYRSNHFEFIIYDKLKDLKRSKVSDKRAIARDNYIQQHLFKDLNRYEKPFEVLRLEVRYGRRNKLKSTLKKLDVRYEDLTLQHLIKKDISQKLLLHQIQGLQDRYPKFLDTKENNTLDFVMSFMGNNPDIKYPKLLQVMGAYYLTKELGSRQYKDVVSKYGYSQWYYYQKQINSYEYGDTKNKYYEFLQKELQEFKTTNLEEYENER